MEISLPSMRILRLVDVFGLVRLCFDLTGSFEQESMHIRDRERIESNACFEKVGRIEFHVPDSANNDLCTLWILYSAGILVDRLVYEESLSSI